MRYANSLAVLRVAGISRKSFPLENEAITKQVAWVKMQK
jgi:hypothetical protein